MVIFSNLRLVIQRVKASKRNFSYNRIKSKLLEYAKSLRADLQQFVRQAGEDPVYLWNKGKHNILRCASATYSLPFVIVRTQDEDGSYGLEATRGFHKWLSRIVGVALLLRCALLCVTMADKDMWLQKGHLTPYANVFTMFLLACIMVTADILSVHSFRTEIPSFYNAISHFNRSFCCKPIHQV